MALETGAHANGSDDDVGVRYIGDEYAMHVGECTQLDGLVWAKLGVDDANAHAIKYAASVSDALA
jgi:hypothetical protein